MAGGTLPVRSPRGLVCPVPRSKPSFRPAVGSLPDGVYDAYVTGFARVETENPAPQSGHRGGPTAQPATTVADGRARERVAKGLATRTAHRPGGADGGT